MRNSSFRPSALALLTLPALLSNLAPPLRADETGELKQFRDQLHVLEQKIFVLERQQELRAEDAAAQAKAAPKITVNDKGFTLASADGANSIKLRGLVQLDNRLFFGDGVVANNAFVLRRARLITEGTVAKNYSFQFVPEFGGGSVSILDANLGVTISPALQFKIGRFKYPVGLELLQSAARTFFNERSLVTNLVPNRDLGLQASGDVAGGTVNYTVGAFNGAPDAGSSNNTDFDNEKDVAARVFASPFKHQADSPLQGLSFGIAGSLGREKTASGRASSYKTDGQQTFFSYASTTVADGQSWRVSPQFDYRTGSFGLLGEYVLSVVNVRPGATGPKAGLKNKAWQLAAGYVLTGEDSSPTGVVPRTNFDFTNGTWGAWEITARVANLKIDDAAFPLFASPASNAAEATSHGVGVNWYPRKTVAFKIDYYQTKFDFAPGAPAVPAAPILRQDEQSLSTRFQLSF